MIKILLIQVPTSYLGAGERVYPVGLSRLSSLVPPWFEKSALDMNIQSDPWRALKNRLKAFKPEIVALSFRNIDPLAGHHASYLSSLKTSAQLCRQMGPQTTILAGGSAFTLFAKRLMQEIPEIDYGLMGEGETAFTEILSRFPQVESVPGVAWRKGAKIYLNPQGPPLEMDDIPEIDTERFLPKSYLKGNTYVAAIGLEGKRGCDLKCVYCVYPYLSGGKVRLRNPGKIVDEMERLKKEHGVRLFHFTDPVVNRPAKHFEALCQELIKRNLKVNWTGFFREDTLTIYNAALAQKAGLIACYFSADALTAQGLKLLNKRLTKAHILKASQITTNCNILTMCHFLVNLPYESEADYEEAREMMDRILTIHAPAGNLGAVIFNTLRLYPDAQLTKKLIKEGLLDPNIDLLYPLFYNPPASSHRLYELEAKCHTAGVLSRLNIPSLEKITK